MGECPVAGLASANGGADVDGALRAWLCPSEHDVYVIGVQECLELPEMRAAMHRVLGGERAYTQYTAEIGNTNTRLGYHGFIALTVYARADDVACGAFVKTEVATEGVATGANLGIARASNKGGVGLPFLLYGTPMQFLTCHLASDSKVGAVVQRWGGEVNRQVGWEVG